MEIDDERGGTDERVGTQVSVNLQLAGGRVQFKFAQSHRTVALGIGSVQHAAGGDFADIDLS